MNWTADAVVLAASPHGERNALVSVLAPGRGRWRGLYRPSARARGLGVAPGDRLAVAWSARAEEHLGRLTVTEVHDRPAARLLNLPDRLAALAAAAALTHAATPERAPADAVLTALETLLTALDGDDWPAPYVTLELAILAELGTPAAPFVAAPLAALTRTGALFARLEAPGLGAPGLRAALAVRARLLERLARFG